MAALDITGDPFHPEWNWVRFYRSPLPTAPPVQLQGADFFAVT